MKENVPSNGATKTNSPLASRNHPFRVYLGYDSHEDITYQVAKFSLEKNASVPVHVQPLKREELRAQGVYRREQDPKQSTEFTYCRFFVPYLNNYKGWALFADDDFLFLGDISELLEQADDRYAVMCVQHDYAPTVQVKLAGMSQEAYPRKNWSSMVLYNCGHPANAALTLDVANEKPGSFLHRFSWITDDSLIGAIDYEWNFLAEWYKPYTEDGRKPKAVHYTEGGPWFPDYRNTDYAAEWMEHMREYEKTLETPRVLCPYERFSKRGNAPLQGYSNSDEPWSWEES
jgi:lipopolysaccharide biosynthesis glycosyltransferase